MLANGGPTGPVSSRIISSASWTAHASQPQPPPPPQLQPTTHRCGQSDSSDTTEGQSRAEFQSSESEEHHNVSSLKGCRKKVKVEFCYQESLEGRNAGRNNDNNHHVCNFGYDSCESDDNAGCAPNLPRCAESDTTATADTSGTAKDPFPSVRDVMGADSDGSDNDDDDDYDVDGDTAAPSTAPFTSTAAATATAAAAIKPSVTFLLRGATKAWNTVREFGDPPAAAAAAALRQSILFSPQSSESKRSMSFDGSEGGASIGCPNHSTSYASEVFHPKPDGSVFGFSAFADLRLKSREDDDNEAPAGADSDGWERQRGSAEPHWLLQLVDPRNIIDCCWTREKEIR